MFTAVNTVSVVGVLSIIVMLGMLAISGRLTGIRGSGQYRAFRWAPCVRLLPRLRCRSCERFLRFALYGTAGEVANLMGGRFQAETAAHPVVALADSGPPWA